GLIIWLVFFSRSEVDQGLAALKETYRDQRPIQARITALNYARFEPTRGNEKGNVDQIKHDRAKTILLDAFRNRPGPVAEHALGEFFLTDKNYDEAILHLEKAVIVDESNAQYHNDLGAALLEKGKVDKQNAEASRNQRALEEGFQELKKSLEHLN